MTSSTVDPLAQLAAMEGVPSAVMAARDAVDAVLGDRGRRVVTPGQSAAALVRAAAASAAIEDDLDGRLDQPRRDSWQTGTTRLYVELNDLAVLIRVAPGQAIARAHAILGRGRLADEDLGRVRSDPDVGERVTALSRILTMPTRAPAIVVAAVAHAELITVAPFLEGNGIVARAVEHLILIDGDLDHAAVTVPEEAHREAGAGYLRALEGYRSGSASGVREWLLYVAATVARGAELSPLQNRGLQNRGPGPRPS